MDLLGQLDKKDLWDPLDHLDLRDPQDHRVLEDLMGHQEQADHQEKVVNLDQEDLEDNQELEYVFLKFHSFKLINNFI